MLFLFLIISLALIIFYLIKITDRKIVQPAIEEIKTTNKNIEYLSRCNYSKLIYNIKLSTLSHGFL